MDLYLVDRNRNFPLVKDFRIHADPTEVYIWGTNANYNLGTGSSSARNIPEPLEVFGNAKISQVSCKAHLGQFMYFGEKKSMRFLDYREGYLRGNIYSLNIFKTMF